VPGARITSLRGDEGRGSRRQREKVEMLLARLKPIVKLDRLQLHGPNQVAEELRRLTMST
jgi:hypothetical protein